MSTAFQAGAFQGNGFQAGKQLSAAGALGASAAASGSSVAVEKATIPTMATTESATAPGRRVASAASSMAARSGYLSSSKLTPVNGPATLGSKKTLQSTANQTKRATAVPTVNAGASSPGKKSTSATLTFGAKPNVSSPGTMKPKATVRAFATNETEISAITTNNPNSVQGVFGIQASYYDGIYTAGFQPNAFQFNAFQTSPLPPTTYKIGSIGVVARPKQSLAVNTNKLASVLKDQFVLAATFTVRPIVSSPGNIEVSATVPLISEHPALIPTGAKEIEAGAAIGGVTARFATLGQGVEHAAQALMVLDMEFVGPVIDDGRNTANIGLRMTLGSSTEVRRVAQGPIVANPAVHGLGNMNESAQGIILLHPIVRGDGNASDHAAVPAIGSKEGFSSRDHKSTSAVQTFASHEGLAWLDHAVRAVQFKFGINARLPQTTSKQADHLAFHFGVDPQISSPGRRITAATIPTQGAELATNGRGNAKDHAAAETIGAHGAVEGQTHSISRSQGAVHADAGVRFGNVSSRGSFALVALRAFFEGFGNVPQKAAGLFNAKATVSSPGTMEPKAQASVGQIKAGDVAAARQVGTGPGTVGSKAGVSPSTVRVKGVGPADIVADMQVVPTNRTAEHVSETIGVKPKVAGIGNLATSMFAVLSTVLLRIAGDGLRRILFGSPDKIVRGVLPRTRLLHGQERTRTVRRADDQSPPRVRTVRRIKEDK